MASGNEQAPRAVSSTELNDEMVRQYLQDHGDFLQRNPDMLDHLHISHASGGAVSLVEKQVGILRERNIDMRRRLKTLTNNARDNDKLYDQTRKLVLQLIEAESPDALYNAFMSAMTDTFKVDYATMILFADKDGIGDCRTEDAETAKQEIGGLLKNNKPVCGVLRKEELAFLFPGAGDVGSAALVPLADDDERGLLAVGSADANRYAGDTGTLFLSHIAEVIVRLLPRLR